jgi:heat shock protein HtpX
MAIIAGAITNWMMLSLAFSLWFDLSKQTTADPNLYASIWAFGLMSGFIGIALSPVGEAFFRFINDCRLPIRAEKDKLQAVFREVCNAARIDPGKYTLYVSDDKFPNAFAMGRKTICVTRSLLNDSTEEELMGVLAHELGHHVHGDAVRAIVFYMVTLVGQLIMFGGWLVAKILGLFVSINSMGVSKDHTELFSFFADIIWGIMWLFQIFAWIPIFIGAYFGSRRQEYRADQYAAEIGFSDGLLLFLNRILGTDGHPKGFMGLLYRTHPKTGDRIRRLETC